MRGCYALDYYMGERRGVIKRGFVRIDKNMRIKLNVIN